MSKAASRTPRAKKDGKYTQHPAGAIFPISPEDRARLKASIERVGRILTPIVVLGTEIVDGWNRWQFSRELNIPCPSVPYKGKTDMASITSFVTAMNIDRRHYNASQLQALAAECARIIQSGREEDEEKKDKSDRVPNLERTNRQNERTPAASTGRSNEIAAKAFGVSTGGVASAKKVMEEAPDLHEKVKAGELSVHAATQEMKRREEPEKPEPVKDEIGGEVPERLAGMFTDIRFDELAGQLRAVKRNIKALTDDPLGVWLHAQDVLASLENVIKAVKFARPHALCPYCKGGGNKGCKTCRKSGWMPVEVYNAVPEADR